MDVIIFVPLFGIALFWVWGHPAFRRLHVPASPYSHFVDTHHGQGNAGCADSAILPTHTISRLAAVPRSGHGYGSRLKSVSMKFHVTSMAPVNTDLQARGIVKHI